MTADRPGRSLGFLLVYALANAGGVVAFLPLLTLLLPLKVEAVAGHERIGVLAATVIAGAIAASLSNIVFGWLSDRSVAAGSSRRGWIGGGIVATAAAYAAILAAGSPGAIVLAIVAYQTAVNVILAPLMATMADEVPDAQKGLTGGLLALANPLASLVSAVLVATAADGEGLRYAIVCAAFALLIAPLLATPARPPAAAAPLPGRAAVERRDLAFAWLARLLVQVAGNVLFLYLLFYFESIVRHVTPAGLAPAVGNVLTIAYALPLPIAVAIGRLSDRVGARKPFLVGAGAVSAGGLAVMAAATGWTAGVIGFGCYAAGTSVFLGLHAALAMQLLPAPEHRGRDLGLLNLTNTLPALIGPALTWWLATPEDFSAVMLVLAALTLAGGLMVLPIRSRR